MADRPLVTDADVPPAGRPGECFWCKEKLGVPHGPECVTVTRKGVVRLTAEYVVDVPAHWTKEGIEFHRNESSWCSSNGIRELDAAFGDESGTCPCGSDAIQYEYVREAEKKEKGA